MRNILLLLLLTFPLSACGDGVIQRVTTIAGIYTVKNPDGYPVVCFIEATHGGVFCMHEDDLKRDTTTKTQ